jgi:hypothetical protein
MALNYKLMLYQIGCVKNKSESHFQGQGMTLLINLYFMQDAVQHCTLLLSFGI